VKFEKKMAEPLMDVENPCVQGGGEPNINTPDLEVKVNKYVT
jgi:hypothetical protein